MVKYAAFLRGIGPLNPNMRNEKLREVFESVGLKNVQTVIETALPEQLGFMSTTIILSHAELKEVAERHPFKLDEDPKKIDQFVAFTKRWVDDFDYPADDNGFGIVGAHGRTLYCRGDSETKQPLELMRWLEKEFRKAVTTRTWRTVERVLKKMESE
jgi:uncharacterized protein (DUF1697 family)